MKIARLSDIHTYKLVITIPENPLLLIVDKKIRACCGVTAVVIDYLGNRMPNHTYINYNRFTIFVLIKCKMIEIINQRYHFFG